MSHSIRWYFHSTAMVRDYERARDALVRLVGLRVLEDTVIEDPSIARRGGLTWIGDNSLELGQPIVPGTGTDLSVTRLGEGVHSIALQVTDLDDTVEHLQSVGSRVIRPSEHLAFSHPKDTGGVFVEWFTDELAFDPRFGGEIPEPILRPVLPVRRMAYTGAVVEEPITLARRLSELTGTDVVLEDPTAPPGFPEAALGLADHLLALFRLPEPGASAELWGIEHRHPRTHVLALEVSDLSEAMDALGAQSIPVTRSDRSGIVIDPEATGRVPILLTDRLVTGDPRT